MYINKFFLNLLTVFFVLANTATAQEVTFGGIGYPHGLKEEVERIAIQKGMAPFGGSGASAFIQTDGGSGSGNNWIPGTEHLPTLRKVCSILGYRTYVRSTCRDFERSSRYPNGKCNFHSPDTDDIVRYYPATNTFRPEHADPKYGKTFVATITCRDPITACSDGIDNDNDGKVDLLDPGCSNPDDTDEKDPPKQNTPTPTPFPAPACNDNKDNDFDGLKDYPSDPGCTSPVDNDETDPPKNQSTPQPTIAPTPLPTTAPGNTPVTGPECSENNYAKILIAMDSGAKAQLRAINKALKQLKSMNKKEKTYAAKTSVQAEELYRNAWTTTWTIPQNITSCKGNINACGKTDFASIIEIYNGYSASLKTLSDQIASRLAKVKGNTKALQAASKFRTNAAALHQANLTSSSQAPRSEDNC